MNKCIYCKSEEFIIMVDKPDYTFLLPTSKNGRESVNFPLLVGCCKSCGLTTELKLPDMELLDRIYGPFYCSYPSSATIEGLESRIKEFLDAYSKFPKGGSVLELGSYDGKLLNVLKERGFDVLGCDPNQSAVDHAKTAYGIDSVVDYFRSDLFNGKQFDLLMSRLLIEHVLEPQTMWVEINRSVKIGGHIAHEVPNARYTLEAGLPFFVPEHTTFFTPASFTRLLEAAGFSLDEIQETPGFLRILAHKTKDIEKLSFDNIIDKKSLKDDLDLAERYAKIFPDCMAKVDTYITEARKSGLSLGIYGAGYFYSYLATFTNLCESELAFACDGNEQKWGAEMPGIKKPVQGPAMLKFPEVGLMVVCTANYQGVIPQMKSFFEQGGRALVFTPEPKLIGATL